MPVNPELLKTACYFTGLDSAALEDVGRFVFEKKLPPEEFVLWEGEEEDVLYFVVTGMLKLFSTSAEGREFTLRIVYGGDSINDEAVINRAPSILSAITLSPVVLYGVRQHDLETVLNSYPQVNKRISEVLSARERYLVRLATDLVFKNVTGRLAHLLLEREKLAHAGGDNLKITQQEMASMIGTVRELVSRSLKEMESNGAISLEHNQIIIKDKNRLEELSEV